MPADLASRILAAHDYSEDLEGAIGAADLAITSGTADQLHEWLGYLGLQDVKVTPWDEYMVARYVLAHHRLGHRFSANTLNEKLPHRARRYARKAVKLLLTGNLIEPAHQCPHCHSDIGTQFELSRRPGSRGWIVQVYQLTGAGERLAAEIAPMLSQSELSLNGYLANSSIKGA
jgi:hypothetical protein